MQFHDQSLDVISYKTRAAPLRRMMKVFMPSGSVQVEVPGADHYYAGKENEAAAEIIKFLCARELY